MIRALPLALLAATLLGCAPKPVDPAAAEITAEHQACRAEARGSPAAGPSGRADVDARPLSCSAQTVAAAEATVEAACRGVMAGG
jgi:hypothetical protein